MDVEQGYLRYQDFGMALATTIVVLILGTLFQVLVDGDESTVFVLKVAVLSGWFYSLYLNLDAVRTQKLDPYADERPFSKRLLIGVGVFTTQVTAGAMYMLN